MLQRRTAKRRSAVHAVRDRRARPRRGTRSGRSNTIPILARLRSGALSRSSERSTNPSRSRSLHRPERFTVVHHHGRCQPIRGGSDLRCTGEHDSGTDHRAGTGPDTGPAPGAARGRVRCVAIAAFLAVAEFGALLLGGAGSPLVAVGSAVIDLAPPAAKDLMVGLFGTGDKVALFVLMAVLTAAISAGAGVLERARPPFGALVLAAGAVLALVAVTTRSGSGTWDGAPTVLGVAAAIVVLRVLLRRLRRWEAAAPCPRRRPARPRPSDAPSWSGARRPPSRRSSSAEHHEPVRRRCRPRRPRDVPSGSPGPRRPRPPSPPARRSTSTASRPTSRRTPTSTASTRRSACRRSIRRTGRSASTVPSTERSS